MRAPIETAIPVILPPLDSHSPVWRPALISIVSACSPSRIDDAAWTALYARILEAEREDTLAAP